MLCYLHVPVDQPVEFKVFVVVPEGVDQLLGDLKEAHVEEELEDGEDGDVEVDVDGDPPAGHPHVLPAVSHTKALNLLAADEGEDEEEVGSKGDHLRIVDSYPIFKPRYPTTLSTLTQIPEIFSLCPVTQLQNIMYPITRDIWAFKHCRSRD